MGVSPISYCHFARKWKTSGADSSVDNLSANTSTESGDKQHPHSEIPESVQNLVKTLGGRLWVRTLCWEYPIDLGSPTRSDDDLSDLKKLYTVSKPSKKKWCAPDTQCPDCDFVAIRGIDLYCHIKDNHPDSKSYACWDCEKNFQTYHDHTNHMNAIHWDKAFHCTVCAFTAAIEHKMLDDVCTHTSRKFECASCNMQLATKSALHEHTLLHLSLEEHKCSHCDKLYTSRLALQVYSRGKHSQGYQYPWCDQVFHTLIKKA